MTKASVDAGLCFERSGVTERWSCPYFYFLPRLERRTDQARILDQFTEDVIMNEQEYIAAYRKIADDYENNQTSMEEYLEALRKLKEAFLKGKTGAVLPVVP